MVARPEGAILGMAAREQFTIGFATGAFRLTDPERWSADRDHQSEGRRPHRDAGHVTRGTSARCSWLQEQVAGALATRRRPAAACGASWSNLRARLNTDAIQLLICEHDRVRLSLAHVKVDARGDVGAPDSWRGMVPGEFLEGLDIADADGFEEWLREQRAQRFRRGRRRTKPPNPPLRFQPAFSMSRCPCPGSQGCPAPGRAAVPQPSLARPDLDYIAEGMQRGPDRPAQQAALVACDRAQLELLPRRRCDRPPGGPRPTGRKVPVRGTPTPVRRGISV